MTWQLSYVVERTTLHTHSSSLATLLVVVVVIVVVVVVLLVVTNSQVLSLSLSTVADCHFFSIYLLRSNKTLIIQIQKLFIFTYFKVYIWYLNRSFAASITSLHTSQLGHRRLTGVLSCVHQQTTMLDADWPKR